MPVFSRRILAGALLVLMLALPACGGSPQSSPSREEIRAIIREELQAQQPQQGQPQQGGPQAGGTSGGAGGGAAGGGGGGGAGGGAEQEAINRLVQSPQFQQALQQQLAQIMNTPEVQLQIRHAVAVALQQAMAAASQQLQQGGGAGDGGGGGGGGGGGSPSGGGGGQ